MVRIGDIFKIFLSNPKVAYGQYVFKDKKFGPLIKIYDVLRQVEDISELKLANQLFPPIITGLSAAIRTGLWTIEGHLPVENFSYPGFVNSYYDSKSGRALSWSFWDGEKFIRLGPILPEEYKKYEYLIVWHPKNVENRIETGEYPFPYKDLIMKNQFTPRR